MVEPMTLEVAAHLDSALYRIEIRTINGRRPLTIVESHEEFYRVSIDGYVYVLGRSTPVLAVPLMSDVVRKQVEQTDPEYGQWVNVP